MLPCQTFWQMTSDVLALCVHLSLSLLWLLNKDWQSERGKRDPSGRLVNPLVGRADADLQWV